MLVIEGKSQKSLYLRDYLKKNANKYEIHDTCVIDYVDIPHILGDVCSHYCSKGDEMSVETAIDDYVKWWKSFINFKQIVFSVNAPKEMLERFKYIEDSYQKKVIVTIQTEEDKVSVYEY